MRKDLEEKIISEKSYQYIEILLHWISIGMHTEQIVISELPLRFKKKTSKNENNFLFKYFCFHF